MNTATSYDLQDLYEQVRNTQLRESIIFASFDAGHSSQASQALDTAWKEYGKPLDLPYTEVKPEHISEEALREALQKALHREQALLAAFRDVDGQPALDRVGEAFHFAGRAVATHIKETAGGNRWNAQALRDVIVHVLGAAGPRLETHGMESGPNRATYPHKILAFSNGSEGIDPGDWAFVQEQFIQGFVSAIGSGLMFERRIGSPLEGAVECEDVFSMEAQDDLKVRVEEALNEIRPALQADGGNVELIDVQEGTAFIHFVGSCSGCPSSTATLQMGIENTLKEMVPEVQNIVAV